MKEDILKLKNELKKLALEVREAKNKRNECFRSGDIQKAGSSQYDVLNIKYEIRHKHIAYCIMRGRSYAQIEPKVREGNEPDMSYVNIFISKEEVA